MDLVCLLCGLAGGSDASGGLLDQLGAIRGSARWLRLLQCRITHAARVKISSSLAARYRPVPSLVHLSTPQHC